VRELLAQCEASEVDLQQQQQQHRQLPSMPSLIPSPAVPASLAPDNVTSRRTKVCAAAASNACVNDCMFRRSLVPYSITLAVLNCFFLIKIELQISWYSNAFM